MAMDHTRVSSKMSASPAQKSLLHPTRLLYCQSLLLAPQKPRPSHSNGALVRMRFCSQTAIHISQSTRTISVPPRDKVALLSQSPAMRLWWTRFAIRLSFTIKHNVSSYLWNVSLMTNSLPTSKVPPPTAKRWMTLGWQTSSSTLAKPPSLLTTSMPHSTTLLNTTLRATMY